MFLVHPLDHFDERALAGLVTWYDANVEDFAGSFRAATVATAGRSNVTLILTDAHGAQTVLRRPPLGDHAPTAHDVCREGRIIQAVGGTGVPVPPVIGICDRDDVIGAPFFVMRFVAGSVLDTTADAAGVPLDQRASLGVELARHLATLHQQDPAAVGLGSLSRPTGFVERQLRRFAEQWTYPDGDDETAAFRTCHQHLVAHQPADVGSARIVHGDYRIGNVIARDGHVAAVLDWELTTLGHPLSDLAYLLNNWVDEAEAHDGPITSPTAVGGFGDRESIVEHYRAAGGDVADDASVAYFRAFSYWRLASIRSGVVARLGTSADSAAADKAAQSRTSIPKLLTAALATLEGVEA